MERCKNIIKILVIFSIIIVILLVVFLIFNFLKNGSKQSYTTDEFLKLSEKDKRKVLENADKVPIIYKDVPLWIYVPHGKKLDNLPVIMIFHGNSRNANDYIQMWKEFSDASLNGYIVICPEFSTDKYPGASKYATGFVLKDGNNADPISNQLVDEDNWTFSIIEPIFDILKIMTGNKSDKYDAWGHSAGAQFLHRFAMLKDSRLNNVVCANAGFYTQPFMTNGFKYAPNYSSLKKVSSDIKQNQVNTILKYPYGLVLKYELPEDNSDTSVKNITTFNDIDNKLDKFGSKNITILLGENDNGYCGPTHGCPQPAPRNTTSSPEGHDYEHKTWWKSHIIWTNNVGIKGSDLQKYIPDIDNLENTLWPVIGTDRVGINRYSRNARGHVYYYGMLLRSNVRNVPFNWQIQIVPKVGHDAQNMARAAYKIFDNNITIVPSETSASTPPDAPSGNSPSDESGNEDPGNTNSCCKLNDSIIGMMKLVEQLPAPAPSPPPKPGPSPTPDPGSDQPPFVPADFYCSIYTDCLKFGSEYKCFDTKCVPQNKLIKVNIQVGGLLDMYLLRIFKNITSDQTLDDFNRNNLYGDGVVLSNWGGQYQSSKTFYIAQDWGFSLTYYKNQDSIPIGVSNTTYYYFSYNSIKNGIKSNNTNLNNTNSNNTNLNNTINLDISTIPLGNIRNLGFIVNDDNNQKISNYRLRDTKNVDIKLVDNTY